MSDVTSVQEQISQAWHRVPAGERRELATRANLKGAQACLLALVFGVTLSFCFKEPTLLLALLAFIPILYQVIATREWIEGKPRIAISYFVAEKTACQYARHYGTTDPSVRLLFKGTVVPPAPDAAESDLPETSQTRRAVWIALFSDRLVMFSERPDGARLEFMHPLGTSLVVLSEGLGDDRDKTNTMYVDVEGAEGNGHRRWVVHGTCPETLAACERKVQHYTELIRVEQERRAALAAEKARLEQERLELRRQERLQLEEQRQAQQLAERKQLIEELSAETSPKPDLGAASA